MGLVSFSDISRRRNLDELWLHVIVSICCKEKLLCRHTNFERGKLIAPNSGQRTTNKYTKSGERSLPQEDHIGLFPDSKWSSLKLYTYKQYLTTTYLVAVIYLEKDK